MDNWRDITLDELRRSSNTNIRNFANAIVAEYADYDYTGAPLPAALSEDELKEVLTPPT